MKIKKSVTYRFNCPACGNAHVFNDSWTVEGSPDKPTVKPSIRVTGWHETHGGRDYVCHVNIKEGMIHFEDDCTHPFKGQTVPLPELI
jgi:hypothetical protein